MTSAIERAKAHFSGLVGKRFVAVPEWPEADGKPFLLFHKPVTVSDRSAVMAAGGSGAESDVDLIIRLATDEQGAPLFGKEDKKELMVSVDGAIVSRIATEMLKTMSVEQAEKNLKAIRG